MDRISAANYAIVGGIRVFQDANLGTATLGTGLNALWHTGVQESVLAPALAVGLTPTDADNTQLLQAIETIAGAHRTAIAANATLTAAEAGVIVVNATSGNVAITLPAVASVGFAQSFVFVRTDTTVNSVTVAPAGSDTWLDGSSAAIVVAAGMPVVLMGDTISKWIPIIRPRRTVIFTGSGTFTAGPGEYSAFLSGVATGGGGAGAYSLGYSYNAGGSGSAGQHVLRYQVSIVPGTSYTVTLGGAGGGGAVATNGAAGAATSFGSLLTLSGGAGGIAGNSSYPGAGGASVATGALAGATGNGVFSSSISALTMTGGRASPSPFGGFGAGGDGGLSTVSPGAAAGQAGGPPILIVET